MAENFDLIFGQNASQQYAWSDNDYQNGWQTVGNIPPTAAQFDALQRRNDMKTKELNDNLTPLVNANTADTRQPATAYNEGDMKFSPLLPTGWFLSCVVAGTTSAGEIVLPSPVVENANVVDGTVTWTIRKIGSGSGEAVGFIKAFAGNGDIPAGYLLCDGAAVSRTMYPDLFAAIGTDYGAGDGSTTFNLPNLMGKFAEGAEVAGTQKEAGLPNITGTSYSMFGTDAALSNRISLYESGSGAFDKASTGRVIYSTSASATSSTTNPVGKSFDASRSSSIYGNSDTVQPNALTVRYIIKAFDGQTADSALIDITQYAQRLEQKADINGSNLVYHKDVITTSGTYTAPVTGLYKITVKGGGGGGQSGCVVAPNSAALSIGGSGGAQGATNEFYIHISANTDISCVIGAGGTGGAATPVNSQNNGGNGGNSSVTILGVTYTASGGNGGNNTQSVIYGTEGFNGNHGDTHTYASQTTAYGGLGGGAANNYGTGGDGGNARWYGQLQFAGENGQQGVIWFEYYTPGTN